MPWMFDGHDVEEIREPSGGIGLADALLGRDGFRVLAVREVPDEVMITVEATRDLVGCTQSRNARRGAGPDADGDP